jgi:hypothetical protein
MAVDFSSRATDVTSTIEPETVVQNPVTREGEIDALNQIGRGLGAAVRVAKTAFDNQATLDANKRLAAFSLDLSRLQDAEDQGLSTAEVQTRARRRLQQELANNPGAEEEILKRYSTWQSQSGYDKVLTPDIQQATIQQAQVQKAVENGFLATDKINDPAAVEKAIDDLENFQRTVRELEVSSKEIANKSAKLDLSGKEKANAKAEAEEVLTNGLAKVGQAALPYWRTQYENIKAAAAKAGSEQERQEIIKQGIIQLEQDFAQRTAAIAGDALNLPQAKIDQILAPQKQLIDTYKKELSGEYDAEMFERQNKTIEARTKLQVWQGLTDEQRQWVTTAQILGPASVVLQGKLSSIVVDMFTKNGASNQVTGGSPDERGQPTTKPADLTYADPTGKANAKAYLDGVTKAIEEVSSGKLDKYPDQKAALQQEVDAQLKGILKGVNVYGNSTESADQFQPLIDFFANPTVGAYLQQAGGIPAQIRGEVAKVFQDGYQTQVVPLLKDELSKMYSRNMKDVAPGGQLMVTVGDVVEPTMEGGRFGFKLKAGVPSDPVVNGIVRTMNNSSFSKVLNKMIISDAHIQGTNDYQKSYETIAPYLFGAEGEQEATTKPQEESSNGYVDPMVQNASADMTLEDFDEDVAAWANPPEGEDIGAELAYASTGSDASPFGAIVAAGKGYTTVKLPDGSVVKRTGSRNWRNNNPGNIEYGPFAKAQGAIGSDGRFAVFPTYEAGRKAKAALLFESKGYKNKSIADAIARYAPDFENDTNAYTNAVARAVGVPASTKLSELTPEQRIKMLNAMERIEGFKPGKEVLVASN